MGLLMDVHDATLLGENALAYTLLSYFAIMIHRRVLWFPRDAGAARAPAAAADAGGAGAGAGAVVSGKFPGWFVFRRKPGQRIALWPLVTWMLLAPQRRAVDRDETRPDLSGPCAPMHRICRNAHA